MPQPPPVTERLAHVSLARRAARAALLVLLFGLLAACNDGRVGTASLNVAVRGLPDGAAAEITVVGEQAQPLHLTAAQRLDHLPPGTYTVRAAPVSVDGVRYHPDPPEQNVVVDRAPLTVTVTYAPAEVGTAPITRGAPGQAGVARGTTLQGVLWDDRDADGRFGPSDVVLPAVTVFLDLDGDGVLGEHEPVTVTDRAGQYRFTGLTPGTGYTLRHAAGIGTPFLPLAAEDPAPTNVKHYVWH